MKLACMELIILLNIYRNKFKLREAENPIQNLRTLVELGLITLSSEDHWIPTDKGYEHINKALEVI
jgi:hypothetical protein